MALKRDPKTGQVVDAQSGAFVGTRNESFDIKTGQMTLGSGKVAQVAEPRTDLVKPDPANLNGDVLGGESADDFQTYDDSPAEDISALNPDVIQNGQIKMTGEEQKAQGLSEDIIGMTNELAGESVYRTKQEDQKGLPGLLETQTELTNQLKTLQNQYKSVPIQMEEWSVGRGVTTSALNRMTDSQRRKLAVESLGLSSLLEATQGNIATAQSLVDRSVSAKYDPIREQIAIAKANLQMIIDSPKYSVEQQNRATAQLAIQNKKAKELAKEEETEINVKNMAIQLASSGLSDNVALQAIQNAGSEIEAMQIAGRLLEGGWEYVNTPLKRDQMKAQGYEIYVNEKLGRTYAKAPASSNEEVQAYVSQIQNGNMKIASVPADLRGDVVAGLGSYSGGGNTSSPSNSKPNQTSGGHTQKTAGDMYATYINNGYSASEALDAVKRLTGFDIKEINYSASNIPSALKNEVINNIQNKAKLSDLIKSYPDISSSYLNSLYGQYTKESKEEAKEEAKDDGMMTDEELKEWFNS
jgi:NACalpha-BTF3-like transcription factor